MEEQKESTRYPLGKTLKKMLGQVNRTQKSVYFYNAVYTVASVVFLCLGVVMPKLLIEQFYGGTIENVWIIVGVFLGAGIVTGFLKVFMLHASYAKLSHIRMNYFRDMLVKLMTMDYPNVENSKFYEQNTFALNACNSNNNGLEGIYHRLFEQPPQILTVLGLGIVVGLLNPAVLAAIVVSILVSFFVSRTVHKYRYRMRESINKAARKINYYSETSHDFAYGKDVRLYNLSDRVLDNYGKEIISYRSVLKKLYNREYAWGFLELFFVLVSDAVTYFVLIYNVVKNGMTIADFSMYLAMAVLLSTSIKKLVADTAFIMNEGQYVYEFYKFVEPRKGEERLKAVEGGTLEIEFKNVDFVYPNTDKYIFKNFNFKINKGEKLAVVGINGAGKSTFVKLMTGLFPVAAGEILVNGKNIKDFDETEYLKMFSAVFQEVNIYPFTVAQNVACAENDVDEAKVWDCLERVGLAEKVRSFDKGLGQPLLKVIDEDGTDLSGGEAQKLAIARALYKDAEMVVLDEPTAALDALAEAEIYGNFNDLVKNKTSVYVSHRLASTKFCDRILLLDENGIAELGTHDSLMAKKGEYYKMFTVQGKYYQETANE